MFCVIEKEYMLFDEIDVVIYMDFKYVDCLWIVYFFEEVDEFGYVLILWFEFFGSWW